MRETWSLHPYLSKAARIMRACVCDREKSDQFCHLAYRFPRQAGLCFLTDVTETDHHGSILLKANTGGFFFLRSETCRFSYLLRTYGVEVVGT